MRELRLLYYRKGFSLTDYDKYWNGNSPNLSGYVSLMKNVPKEEDKILIIPLAKGWATWIKKLLTEKEIRIDIIVRALRHKEIEYIGNKPMSIVATFLAQEIGAEYRTDIIKKTRVTESQTNLDYDRNRMRREQNVKNTIETTDSYLNIVGKNILVLDDIKTTGATLKEIGRVLNRGLKNKIYFLTLAEPREFPSNNIELFSHLNKAMGID